MLLSGFLLALVAFLLAVPAYGLWSLLDGLSSGAAWIDVNAGAAGALPAAVAVAVWALILGGWRMTDRTERRAMRLSFACVPLILLLPLAAGPALDSILAGRGYERCEREFGRRFPGTRYHRGAPDSCP